MLHVPGSFTAASIDSTSIVGYYHSKIGVPLSTTTPEPCILPSTEWTVEVYFIDGKLLTMNHNEFHYRVTPPARQLDPDQTDETREWPPNHGKWVKATVTYSKTLPASPSAPPSVQHPDCCADPEPITALVDGQTTTVRPGESINAKGDVNMQNLPPGSVVGNITCNVTGLRKRANRPSNNASISMGNVSGSTIGSIGNNIGHAAPTELIIEEEVSDECSLVAWIWNLCFPNH